MATCPACRYRFQTLEDEDGMHDCPRCGCDGRPPVNTRTDADVEDDMRSLREDAGDADDL